MDRPTDARIVTRAGESSLLARLVELLPATLRRLEDASAWRGFVVAEPSTSRVETSHERLSCVDRVKDAKHGRSYSLAVHRFAHVGAETEMHDHRYPLAVFPFGDVDTPPRAGDVGGATLYEMPWRTRDDVARQGSARMHVVRDGEPWAITAHRDVWHAVRSLRMHWSVVLADVTDDPARADRLVSTPLDDEARARLVHDAERALRAALARR